MSELLLGLKRLVIGHPDDEDIPEADYYITLDQDPAYINVDSSFYEPDDPTADIQQFLCWLEREKIGHRQGPNAFILSSQARDTLRTRFPLYQGVLCRLATITEEQFAHDIHLLENTLNDLKNAIADPFAVCVFSFDEELECRRPIRFQNFIRRAKPNAVYCISSVYKFEGV